jgi:hypothetical protein
MKQFRLDYTYDELKELSRALYLRIDDLDELCREMQQEDYLSSAAYLAKKVTKVRDMVTTIDRLIYLEYR